MSALFEIELELPLAAFDLALRIESGARTLGLFGPSGSGKTSALEAIAGWRRNACGRLAVDGRVLLDTNGRISLPIEAREIAYVPQDLLLFDERAVRANALFGPRADPDALDRVARILEIAPLLDRRCGSLSGGERQRVALARALCSRPKLLLLDEALGSLDAALRRRILPFLVRIRDEFALPTIFVSHDATDVQTLCDEVVVIERGRVAAAGPARAILRERLGAVGGYENVLSIAVESVERDMVRARIGSTPLFLPARDAPIGGAAAIALAADDVLVSVAAPVGLSARNAIPASIERVRRDGSRSWIEARIDGSTEVVGAALTENAIDELALAPSMRVHLVFKSNACRWIV